MIRRFPGLPPFIFDRSSILPGVQDIQGGVTSEVLRLHLEKQALLQAAKDAASTLEGKNGKPAGPSENKK